jgi:murein DD-endopeptidase MepM/ murein hydrolase activator NlpD
VRSRATILVVLATAVLAARSAAAVPGTPDVQTFARAFAIQVLVPGQDPVSTSVLEAPPSGSLPAAPFAYPADGSAVSADAVAAEVSSDPSDAAAAADVTKLSLFGGEVTADAVAARANGRAASPAPDGDFADAALTNLVVQGQPVEPSPNQQIDLGWGHAILLEEGVDTGDAGTPSYGATLDALDVVLDADHGGLPAGTRIIVGYAHAVATFQPALPPPPVVTVTSEPPPPPAAPKKPPVVPPKQAPKAKAKAKAKVTARVSKPSAPKPSRPPRPDPLKLVAPEPKRPNGIPSPLVLPPPDVAPKLTANRYVFPVFGPSDYTDTFGAPRADVTWHHGDDIFAALGAPILAVADGTVFSVGWNDIGGNRLWLRDSKGNQFYYAHLSAFSTLAVNGAPVHAGDVLGFVGNTGDAEGTPYHLHFEIHPVSLLFLGYDGAVDPTKYLDAWRHLQDIRIVPAVAGGPTVAAISNKAPTPGAILLQSSDISSASGLDPGSLQRALSRNLLPRG